MFSDCEQFKALVFAWDTVGNITYGYSKPIEGSNSGYSLFNYDNENKSIIIFRFVFEGGDLDKPWWYSEIYTDETKALEELNKTLHNVKVFDNNQRLKAIQDDF